MHDDPVARDDRLWAGERHTRPGRQGIADNAVGQWAVQKRPRNLGEDAGPRSGRPPPGGRHAGLATGGLVSERTNLLRLRALLALGDLELDPLVLLQSAVTARLDGREVDEHVSTPAVDGDEAEALVCVEPLHGSLRHAELSF